MIVGLGMLWFSSFAKIQYTGPAIALSLAIGLLAALTLAPVLLHWLRGAVFFPFRPPHHEKGADPEQESLAQIPLSVTWGKIASMVIRRPGLILSVSIAGAGAVRDPRGPDHVQLQPVDRPQPRPAQHHRLQDGPQLLRGRRARARRPS